MARTVGFKSFTVTIASTGVAQKISSTSLRVPEFEMMGKSTNTADFVIGSSDVLTTTHLPRVKSIVFDFSPVIIAGEPAHFDFSRLYVAGTAGDIIFFQYRINED